MATQASTKKTTTTKSTTNKTAQAEVTKTPGPEERVAEFRRRKGVPIVERPDGTIEIN